MFRNLVLENQELNIQEIRTRKVILDSKPQRLGVILTDWCNIRCIMCPRSRNSGSSVFLPEILSKIEELLPYLVRIDWQGGEFYKFSHLKDIFSHLKAFPHIKNSITTNGLLLDEEWIKILSALNAELIFSIDSPVKQTYEYIRRGASYDTLLEKLELIKQYECAHNQKMKREITVVVMKSNYRHLHEFIPFVKQYGFNSINFSPVFFMENEENIFSNPAPNDIQYLSETMWHIKGVLAQSGIGCGWNLPFVPMQDCSRNESETAGGTLYCNLPFNEITDWIRRKFAISGRRNEIKTSQGHKKTNSAQENSFYPNSKALFCKFPWQMLWVGIERGGNIYPNCWCENPVGNIFQDTFLDVWNNVRMQAYRSSIISGDTSLCNQSCITGYSATVLYKTRNLESGLLIQ